MQKFTELNPLWAVKDWAARLESSRNKAADLLSKDYPKRVVETNTFGSLFFSDNADFVWYDKEKSFEYLKKNKEFFDFLDAWNKEELLDVYSTHFRFLSFQSKVGESLCKAGLWFGSRKRS